MELAISICAFATSLLAIYLSHWHKPSKGILCLNNRLFNFSDRKMHRELNYVLSNVGSQELYIKEISLLMGPTPKGNLKDKDGRYIDVPKTPIVPFVLKPGEIRPFTIKHAADYKPDEGTDSKKNKYTLVSIEIIAANGKRYQIAHDISDLGPKGPELDDPIWNGVPLGKAISSS